MMPRFHDHEAIEKLAYEAGEIALEYFSRLASLFVQSKGHLDLVTAADLHVERFLTERLSALFPDDGFFGEEGHDLPGKSGRIWVIDPIDGTFNFVRGRDQWAISIGLYQDGAPEFGVVYAPLRKQLFKGGRGIAASLNGVSLPPLKVIDPTRAVTGVGFHTSIPVDRRLPVLKFIMSDAAMVFFSNGSATISMLELALGQVDGYIGLGESSWDVMGVLPILECLGAKSTLDWTQIPLSSKLEFACGTPEFLKIIDPLMPKHESI